MKCPPHPPTCEAAVLSHARNTLPRAGLAGCHAIGINPKTQQTVQLVSLRLLAQSLSREAGGSWASRCNTKIIQYYYTLGNWPFGSGRNIPFNPPHLCPDPCDLVCGICMTRPCTSRYSFRLPIKFTASSQSTTARHSGHFAYSDVCRRNRTGRLIRFMPLLGIPRKQPAMCFGIHVTGIRVKRASFCFSRYQLLLSTRRLCRSPCYHWLGQTPRSILAPHVVLQLLLVQHARRRRDDMGSLQSSESSA